jgi:hypothetical protein
MRCVGGITGGWSLYAKNSKLVYDRPRSRTSMRCRVLVLIRLIGPRRMM